MKPLLTRDLKIKFLGITPVLVDKTGVLNPQQIVALSALLTFKGKSIKDLLKDIKEKSKDVDERIVKILQKSSLRGHASIATTPSLCLTYEGSKFLDSVLTGIVFSSSLVSSGRRTDTTKKDIVYPSGIFESKKAKKIYQKVSENIIGTYNHFLEKGVQKDEASKLLQYGIFGTGIIQLPIESIVGLKREYLAEKEWMPEEVGILLSKIEEEFKNFGLDTLYSMREAAPRNVYPYPNIFKNPRKSNITRELIEKEKILGGTKLISMDILETPGLKEKLLKLGGEIKESAKSFEGIKKNWMKLLVSRQEILRDYNQALRFKILSSIPWRVWGEKKRHRTVPQIIESIYYSASRALKTFNRLEKEIKKNEINEEIIGQIQEVFSIPPSIEKNPELLKKYLLVSLDALQAYQKLISLKIKPREAIFLVPRAVKIDILQEYDLYNLLTGYFPLRLCSTAEEEMRRKTVKEVADIKTALKKKGQGWLADFIVPKCFLVGFCPEEKTCFKIKGLVKKYNEEFHREMKKNLQKRFEKNLKNLGK
jgi:effector-binding domain-containing protein